MEGNRESDCPPGLFIVALWGIQLRPRLTKNVKAGLRFADMRCSLEGSPCKHWILVHHLIHFLTDFGDSLAVVSIDKDSVD